MNKSNLVVGILVFLIVFTFLPTTIATYERSNPSYTNSNLGSSLFGFGGIPEEQCQMGQDFVIQITPFGCTPVVVRSDLLEEQDTPVFCQLSATKINPLIDVNAIESMEFTGGWPEEVRDVGFMPNRDALRDPGKDSVGKLSTPFMDNVGYAVIVLRQQPNSSQMPDSISGKIPVKIYYNIENAFGLGKQSFYLPELSDSDWNKNYVKYSFWNNKGYLRADDVSTDSARITLYNDVQKLQTFDLKVGDASSKYYMPGFDCLAGLSVSLDKVDVPDTQARISVNGNIEEARVGESFLNGACRVSSIDKRGVVESVSGSCRTDEGNDGFTLSITPKVNITICDEKGENCINKNYSLGDILYMDSVRGYERNVYLGYIGQRLSDKKYFIVPVVSPQKTSENFLVSTDSSLATAYGDLASTKSKGGQEFSDFVKGVGGDILKFASAVLKGSDYGDVIAEKETKQANFVGQNVLGVLDLKASLKSFFTSWEPPEYSRRQITFEGFVGATDLEFGLAEDADAQRAYTFYQKSILDLDHVMENYKDTKYDQPQDVETKGEEALIYQIWLADSLGQKESLRKYCNQFKVEYPDSSKKKSLFSESGLCSNLVKLASSTINRIDFIIGGKVYELSLDGISEPSETDYSAVVVIDGEDYIFTKDDEKLLNLNVDKEVYTYTYSGGNGDKNSLKTAMAKALDEKGNRLFVENSICYEDKVLDTIISEANKNGIDPLIILALIAQESRCNADAKSVENSAGSAYGLMQIYSWKECIGEGIGVNQQSDVVGIQNIEKNIACGITILKKKYGASSSTGGVWECPEYTFKEGAMAGKTEPAISTKYDKGTWQYALRGYNGWTCAGMVGGKEVYGDNNFVEDVSKKIDALGGSLSQTVVEKKTIPGSIDSIKLKSLGDDYAVFDVSGINHEGMVPKPEYSKTSLKIGVGSSQIVGTSNYNIIVKKVNLKKVALVSVRPDIDHAGTETNLSFSIGIEKRGIQLTPEQINKKIDTLNASIDEWGDKSSKLGKVVTGLRAACVGVNAYLTVKNFMANTKGKAIARSEVMRGSGGWYDRCVAEVRAGRSDSIEKCLSDNAKSIEADVDSYYEALQKQNDRIKEIQAKYEKDGILGSKTVDSDAFCKDYLDSIRGDLAANMKSKLNPVNGEVEIQGDKINVDNFVNGLDCSKTTFEDLRELELHSSISGNSEFMQMTEKKLTSNVKTIYVNTKDIDAINDWRTVSGDSEATVLALGSDLTPVPYSKILLFEDVSSKYEPKNLIAEKAKVQTLYDKTAAQGYLFVLDDNDAVTATYKVSSVNGINQLVKYEGKDFSEEQKLKNPGLANNPLKLEFKKYDKGAYENGYINPEVSFYETEPYSGLPAIVPVDLEEGWYASIKQTLPVGGSIRSYDESGRVSSFYLCNVGVNGIEDGRGNDDICEMINTGTGMPYDQFVGLPSTQAKQLVDDAVSAIAQASKQSGNSKVSISYPSGRKGFSVVKGEPAADIPDMKCEDFMSPTDCKLLFNVCDPVICPSSRCDLGGAYPVKDVIQTGIFGSVALCLPNFPQVYVPVCLTGIKAGIDGWLSVQKSYRDCLQTNLETGETIGICDEIHSIYACEFFWRQGIPIAKLLLPKLIENAAGQGARGGGEYLGVQSAFSTAEKSVDYFTQYYAANSYAAFQAKSVDEVGTEVCKASVSMILPEVDAMLDVATRADSPPQFTGRFDEIPYTSATNPPISQYKVFYHIFAGDSQGVYYKVYLKGDVTSTYYQDTGATRVVGSNFIPAGEYATDTVDFTAPSGYKQLCIMVNQQEECGFQQVSTDFALNYVEDKYLAQQANSSDVKSAAECISGSRSLYSLLNPNLQEGLDEVVNPELYNHGIVRICATENPGGGTDEFAGTKDQRYVDVGYCDDKNIRCWLDKKSVEEVIKNANILNRVLESQDQKFLDEALKSGEYLDEVQFAAKLDELNKSSETQAHLDNVNSLTTLMGKVIYVSHKGHLYYLRGVEYGELAKIFFKNYLKNEEARRKTKETPGMTEGEAEEVTEEELALPIDVLGAGETDNNQIPVFEFEDGTMEDNIYYAFFDGHWKFSIDAVLWIDISTVTVYSNQIYGLGSGAQIGDVLTYTPNFMTVFSGLSKKNQDFVLGLEKENFDGGLLVLMNRVVADNEGGIANPSLVVRNINDPLDLMVEFTSRDMFRIFNFGGEFSKELYMGFVDGEWQASWDGGDTWNKIDYSVISKPQYGYLIDYTPALYAVQGKNALEGSKSLFNLAASTAILKIDEQKVSNIYGQKTLEETYGEFSCSDCGKDPSSFLAWRSIVSLGLWDSCDEKQCDAIGTLIRRNCKFESNWYKPGGTCTDGGEVVTNIQKDGSNLNAYYKYALIFSNNKKLYFTFSDGDKWVYEIGGVSYKVSDRSTNFGTSAHRNLIINEFGSDNYQRINQIVDSLSKSNNYYDGSNILKDSGAAEV